MKRLCIFYKFSYDWIGKPVEWIVCKRCQKKLRAGEKLIISEAPTRTRVGEMS